MAIVSVGTTATLIAQGNKAGATSPNWALIQNLDGTTTVYFDTTDQVTANTASTGGMQIAAGDDASYPLSGSDKLYAIVASGSVNVAVPQAVAP